MDEASHLLQLFFFDEFQGIEILDFGGDLASKLGSVKLGDTGHSALTGQQFSPHLFRGVAHPTDQADSGDYDPTSQLLPAFRVFTDVIEGVLYGADFFRVL